MEERKTVWKSTLPPAPPHVTEAPALDEDERTAAAPSRESLPIVLPRQRLT
jgi:hypothetical protein